MTTATDLRTARAAEIRRVIYHHRTAEGGRVEDALRAYLRTAPGSWGESVQAWDRLRDAADGSGVSPEVLAEEGRTEGFALHPDRRRCRMDRNHD